MIQCEECITFVICKNRVKIECSAMFDRMDDSNIRLSEDEVLEMLDLFSKDEIIVRKPGCPGEWVISRREENES